jgi:hypothetical protein
MTAEAIQPSLDLGDYRGKGIASTTTKLANTNDGFDPSSSVDGDSHIYEIGEVLTIACRVVVLSHTPKLIEKDGEDQGKLNLLQTWKVISTAVVSDKAVAKELNAIEKAQAAAKAAKVKATKKVMRSNIRQMTDGPKAVGESLQEALGQS